MTKKPARTREILTDEEMPGPKRLTIPWELMPLNGSVVVGYNASAACDYRNLNFPPKIFMSRKDSRGVYRIWRIA